MASKGWPPGWFTGMNSTVVDRSRVARIARPPGDRELARCSRKAARLASINRNGSMASAVGLALLVFRRKIPSIYESRPPVPAAPDLTCPATKAALSLATCSSLRDCAAVSARFATPGFCAATAARPKSITAGVPCPARSSSAGWRDFQFAGNSMPSPTSKAESPANRMTRFKSGGVPARLPCSSAGFPRAVREARQRAASKEFSSPFTMLKLAGQGQLKPCLLPDGSSVPRLTQPREAKFTKAPPLPIIPGCH